MTEIEKIVKELMEKFNIHLEYYAENAPSNDLPICDWQFDKVTDDGSHTFSPLELMQMDWLCENVVGTFPDYDQILPFSRPMVDLLGIEMANGEVTGK